MPLKPENVIRTLAVERSLPYRMRKQAHDEMQSGMGARFSLTVQLEGSIERGPDASAPALRTVLCRTVVAEAARRLRVRPERLSRCLEQAARKSVEDGRFTGFDGQDEQDPHVQAIRGVEAKLKDELPVSARAGSVKVLCPKPVFLSQDIDI